MDSERIVLEVYQPSREGYLRTLRDRYVLGLSLVALLVAVPIWAFAVFEPLWQLRALAIVAPSLLILGLLAVAVQSYRAAPADELGELRVTSVGVEFTGPSNMMSAGGRFPWSRVDRVRRFADWTDKRHGIEMVWIYPPEYRSHAAWQTVPRVGQWYLKVPYLSNSDADRLEKQILEELRTRRSS